MIKKNKSTTVKTPYSIEGITTAQALRTYVQKAMQECHCTPSEIKEYSIQATKYDFSYMQQISKEYIDLLNERNKPQECKISYLK